MRHTHRCVVDAVSPGEVVVLSQAESHHLVRVARRAPGDSVELIDEGGALWPATIEDAGPPARVRVGAAPLDPPPTVALTLVVGLADFGRLDTLVEKATELGIRAVTIMSSARARRVPDASAFASRRARLLRVAEAAAKQSGRPRVPAIGELAAFEQVIAHADPAATIVVDPRGDTAVAPLLARVVAAGPVTVIVGPDAGLSDDEIAAARAAGVAVAGLGEAILRTETAAIAVAVLAAAAAGVLGA